MFRANTFATCTLRRAAVLGGALLLGSCGGGGGGGAAPRAASSVSLAATTLALGDCAYAYEQRLSAQGGSGRYRFAVVDGALPPGLSLDDTGRIAGTPAADGAYPFQVEVRDDGDGSSARRLFEIEVGRLHVTLSTPHFGVAWAGDVCVLEAPSETRPVSFALTSDDAGSSVSPPPSPANWATFRAGPRPGLDVVRCTNASGAFLDVPIEVRPDPFGEMTARFGTTDVWYVDFDAKYDPANTLDTDFDAALVRLGLRGRSSEGAGLPVEQLARAAVIHEALSWVNRIFLNHADGSPDPAGLAVTLPFRRPESPYDSYALPGGEPAAPGLYNEIALHGLPFAYPSNPWYFETICPDFDNAWVESLIPMPGVGTAQFGVFLVNLAPGFNQQYANASLPFAPIAPEDQAAIESVLYDQPAPAGARAAEVRRVARDFGRLLAVIIAQIIDYNVGLDERYAATSLMGPWTAPDTGQWTQWPSEDFMPALTPDCLRILEGRLPGPNR